MRWSRPHLCSCWDSATITSGPSALTNSPRALWPCLMSSVQPSHPLGCTGKGEGGRHHQDRGENDESICRVICPMFLTAPCSARWWRAAIRLGPHALGSGLMNCFSFQQFLGWASACLTVPPVPTIPCVKSQALHQFKGTCACKETVIWGVRGETRPVCQSSARHTQSVPDQSRAHSYDPAA